MGFRPQGTPAILRVLLVAAGLMAIYPDLVVSLVGIVVLAAVVVGHRINIGRPGDGAGPNAAGEGQQVTT